MAQKCTCVSKFETAELLNGKLYILAILAPQLANGSEVQLETVWKHMKTIGKTRILFLRIKSPREVRTKSGQRYEIEGTERNKLVDYEGRSCEKQTLTSAQQHSP